MEDKEVVEQSREATADVAYEAYVAYKAAEAAWKQAKDAMVSFGPGEVNGVSVAVVKSPKVVAWDEVYRALGVSKEGFGVMYKHSKGETVRVTVKPRV